MPRACSVILLAAMLAAMPDAGAARIAPVGPQPTRAVVFDLDETPFDRELQELYRSIQDARDSGLLTRTEARKLRREARLLRSLAHRYASDGLSPDEYRELEFRAVVARQQADARRAITFGEGFDPLD